MSLYTTELRFICETNAGLSESVGYNDVDRIIDLAIPNIFNFDFPIFDEKYRNVLCHKILKHYYTREISEETVGLWRLRLNTKMNEIMPYYNKLYSAWSIEFNPLHDTDFTTNRLDTKTNDENTKSTTNGTGWNLYSDTPQGSLQNIENETYLTNATKNTENATGETDRLATTTDEYIEQLTGKSSGKSFSEMLGEYKEHLINIDILVISELSTLFFGLWE